MNEQVCETVQEQQCRTGNKLFIDYLFYYQSFGFLQNTFSTHPPSEPDCAYLIEETKWLYLIDCREALPLPQTD